ncbi:MAG: hypothetical protein JWO36_4176 [Myxococcales bacterium]|nr:hypothetical protein [Myxococcales bacterium]
MRDLSKLGLLLFSFAACGHDMANPGGGSDNADASVTPGSGDPLGGLPTGDAQWSAVCGKHYGDMITAKFCAGTTPPVLTSLADLEALLGLTVQPNPNNDPAINPNIRITLNSESESIGMRHVTAINPRAFIMTAPVSGANPQYQVLAFSRGEPFVELVANDAAAHTLRFFLVRFHPSCEPTCNNADLLTPTIEAGWTGYSLYDDATIKNTTLDCLNCHQPGGPASQKILRMQELQNPWAHWFYPERPQTLQTVHEFQAAHPAENYGGIPYQNVYASRPFVLMQLAQNNGFAQQPNAFNTLQINTEMTSSGSSATWDSLYAKSVAGLEIPVPYFMTPHTDPTKVQAMTAAYQQTIAGTLPRDQMPDINDTVLDTTLPFLSVRPKPGLDGRGILTHMCRMCHNSQLDQTISRAAFNIDTLDQLPQGEKDLAVARLMLPTTDAHHMPPVRFHELSQAERDLAIQELQK